MRKYFNKLCKKIVLRNLSNISKGTLSIVDDGNKYTFGHDSSINAEIKVNNPRFYTEVLLGGSIGAGESFIRGYWSSDDLTRVIQLMARNQSTMDTMEGPFKVLMYPFLRALHTLNKNTLYGSKKNISRHYDLSNKFFSLFLDSSMMYSAAIYKKNNDTLEIAAENKLEVICQKLNLNKSHQIIEIGSGWGGFAIYAAKKYGCHITTTTISH